MAEQVTKGESIRYYAALDGIRALAVLAVLIAHSAIPYPRSGGVAVDLFFVLSGFLITSVIVAGVRGRTFRFYNFYARRFLKLVPCLLTVCLFVFLTHKCFGSVNWSAIILALKYTTNWATAVFHIDSGSLVHCWSLSIEEQYYLLWPLIVVAIEAKSRDNIRNGLVLVVFSLFAALYRSAFVGVADSVRINFPLDTRMSNLIMGSALSYLVREISVSDLHFKQISRVLAYAVCPLCVGVLVWIMFTWHWTEPRMGKIGYLLVGLSSSMIILDVTVGRHSMLRWPLELAVLRYIGRISYGIYLYHLPVYELMDYTFVDCWLPQKILTKIGCSIIIAAASFHVIELPFLRLKGRFRASPAVLMTSERHDEIHVECANHA